MYRAVLFNKARKPNFTNQFASPTAEEWMERYFATSKYFRKDFVDRLWWELWQLYENDVITNTDIEASINLAAFRVGLALPVF